MSLSNRSMSHAQLEADAVEAPPVPCPTRRTPIRSRSCPPLLDALVVPLADTTSPTWPESETIVPSSGA